MAKTKPLLNVNEILSHYIQVIDNAKSECIIATPYYQGIPELEEAIERAESRGVIIKMYGRKGEEEQFEELEDYNNIELHFIERLHAKIVRNETEMVCSSMNLTESSVDKNVEAGTFTTDPTFMQKLENEYGWLKIITKPESKKTYYKRTPRQYCKRCGRPKRYKPNEPLCLDCYSDDIADDIGFGYDKNYENRSEWRRGFEEGYKGAYYDNYHSKYSYRNDYSGYGNSVHGRYGGYGRW